MSRYLSAIIFRAAARPRGAGYGVTAMPMITSQIVLLSPFPFACATLPRATYHIAFIQAWRTPALRADA